MNNSLKQNKAEI